ncbi:MAG: class B sortase [Lachnospiraceae bacterium]|nr:class B sortase [Lachnospiraceae bacterium]
MLFVQGVGFNTKSEYEAALEDEELIKRLRSEYDLNNPGDVERLYNDIRNIHFKTKVGDNFDDYIYGLYLKIKDGTFPGSESTVYKGKAARGTRKTSRETNNRETSITGRETSGKRETYKKRETFRDLDDATKAGVISELRKQNIIRTAVIIVLLSFAAFSIGYFVKYYSAARRLQESTDNLTELKENTQIASMISVKPVINRVYPEEIVVPDILEEYQALYNKNKSLVGWIKIDDTVIDYPVTQTEDNEYYLKHNFNLKEDANGCIFLDAACDIILGNTNWILYGHHMNNGKMFSSLIKYANKDFYEKHKYIQFDTIYEKGTYEVMYAFRSRVYASDVVTFKYYQFIDALSAEEFDSAMEEMAKDSLIDTGVTASFGDRLLTLSTCDYQEQNGRFVVVAKRIE